MNAVGLLKWFKFFFVEVFDITDEGFIEFRKFLAIVHVVINLVKINILFERIGILHYLFSCTLYLLIISNLGDSCLIIQNLFKVSLFRFFIAWCNISHVPLDIGWILRIQSLEFSWSLVEYFFITGQFAYFLCFEYLLFMLCINDRLELRISINNVCFLGWLIHWDWA